MSPRGRTALSDPRDPRDVRDVQAMSGLDTQVYEAVAMRAVEDREPTAADVAGLTGVGEEEARRSLETLAERGWLRRAGRRYRLGPHDWGLDY